MFHPGHGGQRGTYRGRAGTVANRRRNLELMARKLRSEFGDWWCATRLTRQKRRLVRLSVRLFVRSFARSLANSPCAHTHTPETINATAFWCIRLDTFYANIAATPLYGVIGEFTRVSPSRELQQRRRRRRRRRPTSGLVRS